MEPNPLPFNTGAFRTGLTAWMRGLPLHEWIPVPVEHQSPEGDDRTRKRVYSLAYQADPGRAPAHSKRSAVCAMPRPAMR